MGHRKKRKRKVKARKTPSVQRAAAVSPPRATLAKRIRGVVYGKRLAFLLAVVGLLVGVIPFVAVLNPTISVQAGDEMIAGDVLTHTFEVANASWCAITDLKCEGELASVEVDQKPALSRVGIRGGRKLATLPAGSKHTIQLPRAIDVQGSISKAELYLVLKYRYWWQREERFRFLAVPASDGRLKWRPVAESS
jgi:hypothetical protein